MKKNVLRSFLRELKNHSLKKHLFFRMSYDKICRFLVYFLTKEGYLRGFFLVENYDGNKKTTIFVILKYNEKSEQPFFIKNKNVLMNKIQFAKQKKLSKFCNGLGLVLIYTIKGFISNEIVFWFKLGGKKIIEIK